MRDIKLKRCNVSQSVLEKIGCKQTRLDKLNSQEIYRSASRLISDFTHQLYFVKSYANNCKVDRSLYCVKQFDQNAAIDQSE